MGYWPRLNSLRCGSGAAFHITDRGLQTAAVREDPDGVGFEDQGSLAVVAGEFQDPTLRQVLRGQHLELRVALEHSASAIANLHPQQVGRFGCGISAGDATLLHHE